MSIFFSGSRGAWAGSILAATASIYLFIAYKFGAMKAHLSNLNIKNKIDSKLIVYSILLFFILMPVSFFVLRQNQEAQFFVNGIYAGDMSKSILFERAMSIYNFSEISNKGRVLIWKETLISIGEHPFWGVGVGNFPNVLGENLSASKKGSSAHNIYFDIASEIGIFGLMVFLFMLVEVAEYSYRLFHRLKQKHLRMFAGSFFVYFIWICAYGFFDIVILNDKVLIITVILVGVLYSLKVNSGYLNVSKFET